MIINEKINTINETEARRRTGQIIAILLFISYIGYTFFRNYFLFSGIKKELSNKKAQDNHIQEQEELYEL